MNRQPNPRSDQTLTIGSLRTTLALVVAGPLLTGCAASQPDASPADPIEFVELEIPTAPAIHQTVLTASLLEANTMDLVVIGTHAHGLHRLHVYAERDGDWTLTLDAPLRHELEFVDIASIGGRDRLISYSNGEFFVFDPESATEHPLVSIPLEFNADQGGPVPRVDLTRDLNHDGRDDLVVPDVDGFWISTQRSDGSFTEPRMLAHPEPFADVVGLARGGEGFDQDASRSYRDIGVNELTVHSYLSRVHELDYNRDGLSDLALWNEDHFEVHLQETDGQFGPVGPTFTVDVPIDSDGSYSRIFAYSDDDLATTILGVGEYSKQTVIHSFRDLDSDGIADLITVTFSGRSLLNQRSVYEVRFGTATPDHIAFPADPSSAFEPDTRAGALLPWGYFTERFHDFNGDGQTDIGFHSVRMGLDGVSRALVGNSIAVDLELYQMTDGAYTREPTLKRRVRPSTDPFRSGPYFPVVLVGDASGDGLAELITGKSPTTLDIFVGVRAEEPFKSRPQRIEVSRMPSDERHVWMADMNSDGKQDIVMHHANEPKHVTILIAQ